MPLKLNIGLNRKVGEANYGSRGASVNLEIELDSQLVGDTAKLQEKIRQSFGMVRASRDEELNGNGNGHATPNHNASDARPRSNNGNGTNRTNGSGSNNPRPATQSQVKAIIAIARRHRIDLAAFLQERFHITRPEDLSIQDASTVIDTLKESDTSNRS
jgi:hypothetical protein